MAHPYANAAGYILASDAISQDEYRYKQGGEDDDRRPTHRRRWSFGFRRSRDLSSTNSSGLSSPSSTAYSASSTTTKPPSFSSNGKIPSPLTTPTSASTTVYSSTTSYSPPASYSNHSYGTTKASPSFSSPTIASPSKSNATSPSTAMNSPSTAMGSPSTTMNSYSSSPSATSQSKGVHPTNSPSTTSNTTAYIISPSRGYVYPDDTWSVMTPGTPSVMRLGFDGRVGARTPDPFGRGVTPEPFGRGVTPEPFGRRTPEPGRALTGRLTPEFGRAMMRTPEPGGWWAAETSRMWLTPEPDARCSGWAGMGCFTNGKVGCVARMPWKARQMKKGVKARARKTAAALRRLASAMKGDAKA